MAHLQLVILLWEDKGGFDAFFRLVTFPEVRSQVPGSPSAFHRAIHGKHAGSTVNLLLQRLKQSSHRNRMKIV